MKKIIFEKTITISLIVLAFFSSTPAFLLVRINYATQNNLLFSFTAMMGALLTMIVIPYLIFKKENFIEYGFRLPEVDKKTWIVILLPFTILIPIIHLISGSPEFQKYYTTKQGINFFFITEVFISFFYFVSEEFFFRGFLFFSLYKKIGAYSYLLTNLVFTLMHIGKPSLELFIAFILGIWFSYISKKTNSFFPAAVIHFTIALYLNLLINI